MNHDLLHAFNRLWVIKTGLLDLYMLSIGIGVVKTGMTILSTILPVVKMCLGNIHRALTSSAVVETCLVNNYSPSIRFDSDKTAFTGLRQASWQSKRF